MRKVALFFVVAVLLAAAAWMYRDVPGPKDSIAPNAPRIEHASTREPTPLINTPVADSSKVPSSSLPETQDRPSVASYMHSLVEFAIEVDLHNCRKVIVELQRYREEAAPLAKARFEEEAAKPHPPRAKLYVLAFLGLLLNEVDSELLFTPLRRAWTKDQLSPGRAKLWAKTEIMPLDHAAEHALSDEEDKLRVNVAAFVIRDHAIEGRIQLAHALLDLSIAPYVSVAAEPKDLPETPDPWLSSLLTGVVPVLRSLKLPDSTIRPLRQYCSTIQSTRTFSPRLRHQARCLFIEAAKDEVTLMAELSAAATKGEASKVLAFFLGSQGPSALDWALVLDLFSSKFGLSAAHLALSDAIYSAANQFDVEKWGAFAASFMNSVSSLTLSDEQSFLVNAMARSITGAAASLWTLGKRSGPAPAPFSEAALAAFRLCEAMVDRQENVKSKVGHANGTVHAMNLALNIIASGHNLSDTLKLLRRHCEKQQRLSAPLVSEVAHELLRLRTMALAEQSLDAREFLDYLLCRSQDLGREQFAPASLKRAGAKAVRAINAYAKIILYPTLSPEATKGLQNLIDSCGAQEAGTQDVDLTTALRELREAGYLK